MALSLSFLCATCAIVAVSNGQALFQRPLNADCVVNDINAVTAASAGGVQYYPRTFQTDGITLVDNQDMVKIDSAIGFDVTYMGNVKVANNSISGEVYVLYQCGTAAPNPKDYPQGAKFVQIPLTAVVVPDTTAYAFLSALGVEDRVNNVTSLVVGACGQRLSECGKLLDGMLDTTNSSQLLSAFGPTTDGLFSTMPTEVPFGVAINAPMDPGPLNRAEWIKFVSLFFNKEQQANKYYNDAKQQYNSIKETAQKSKKNSKTDAPLVAWVSYMSTFPPKSYQISVAEYKNALVKDAGGRVLNRTDILAMGAERSAFSPLLLEFTWGANQTFETKAEAQAAVYELLLDVDVIIDETYSMDPASYNLTDFLDGFGFGGAATPLDKTVNWWNNSAVLRYDGIINANGGLDWFESAVVNPHTVLGQLTAYLYPTKKGNIPTGYFRNIATDDEPLLVSSDTCNAIATCTTTPTPICPYVRPCSAGPAAVLEKANGGDCSYAACSN